MQLQDYPRPPDDTGIGVHWSAGSAAAVGRSEIRERWLPLLQEMGVKWVKIGDPHGGLVLAELLLEHEIMPIVRLVRPQPNPGVLNAAQLAQLDDLIRAGVRYIEFNQEPDLPTEWQGGRMPPDALAVAAQNAAIDMERILERGGMPGVPAVRSGSSWNLTAKIVEQGGRSLFDGPVWQAVHNYSLNHPLDYPYDGGNQEGAPYSQEFYETLYREVWGGSAWQGRSLGEVNRLRAKYAEPGQTILEDSRGWLAFQRFDALNQAILERSIPILSTENGYLVGEGGDPRYPAISPALHLAQTLEACRIMMGSSRRFPAAPDYYFCTAFWLLGNYELGSFTSWWEPHAWFSTRWPGGALPIVSALKAEPKVIRQRAGKESQGGDQPLPQTRGYSTLGGTVRGGAGVTLWLESTAGAAWETLVRPDGSYRFVGLPAGQYRLTLESAAQGADADPPSALDGGVELTGHNHVLRDLARPGWGYTITTEENADDLGRVYCQVEDPGRILPDPDHTPLTAQAQNAVWRSPTVPLHKDPVQPVYGCQLDLLEPGLFTITVQGLAQALVARVYVDGNGQRVRFVYTVPPIGGDALPRPHGSVIAGSAPEATGQDVQLLSSQGQIIASQTAEQGQFRFEGLAPGEYALAVADLYHQDGLVVDGRNGLSITFAPLVHNWVVQVDESPSQPTFGIIQVRVLGRPNWPVRIESDGWEGQVVPCGSQPGYDAFGLEFVPLQPGLYRVRPEGLDVQATVRLEPGQTAQVVFKQDKAMSAPPQVNLLPGLQEDSQSPQPPQPEIDPTPGQPLPAPASVHYLLVGDGVYEQEDLIELIRYVERFDPVVGDDLAEAAQAGHVTLLGDETEEMAAIAVQLQDAGIVLDRIHTAFAQSLAGRTNAGIPW